MDMLVCFKVAPDLDKMAEEDWAVDEQLQVNTTFVANVLNPYDESALELVLKMRDSAVANRAELQLTALTVGPEQSQKTLKNLLALKYDQAVRLDCNLDLRFNAPAVATLIQRYLVNKKMHPVIFFGSQSNEGDNGKTPLLVAERLGIPCIVAVTGVALSAQAGCLDVTAQVNDLLLNQTVRPPVILVVGNAPHTYLRVPTLKDKMQSAQKAVTVYSLADLGLDEPTLTADNDLEIIGLSRERHGRNGVRLDGESVVAIAAKLYEDYLKQRVKR